MSDPPGTHTFAKPSKPEISVAQETLSLSAPKLRKSGSLSPTAEGDAFIYKGTKVTSRFVSTPTMKKRKLQPFDFEPFEGYDYSKPTHENYGVDSDDFFGDYVDIRKTRDFKFHGNYTQDRQMLQDTLIADVIGGGTKDRQRPWIVFTAGPMGAGKSHVIHWMSVKGHFPLPDIVQIDPDQFRSRLPEWKKYLSTNPEFAGRLTHKECGLCVEIAQEAALRQGKHIWVDGSLRDSIWYREVFNSIRSRHPKYRIAILQITAPTEVVLKRAANRAKMTGRIVPQEDLLASIKAVPAAVNDLVQEVDFLAVIENGEEKTPKLKKVCNEHTCLMLQGDDWTEVSTRFAEIEVNIELLKDKYKGLIHENKVVIFSKSYCSFCCRAKTALDDAGVEYIALDMDTIEDGVALQTAIARVTKQHTTPQIFVDGKFLGGCSEVLELLESGNLKAGDSWEPPMLARGESSKVNFISRHELGRSRSSE